MNYFFEFGFGRTEHLTFDLSLFKQILTVLFLKFELIFLPHGKSFVKVFSEFTFRHVWYLFVLFSIFAVINAWPESGGSMPCLHSISGLNLSLDNLGLNLKILGGCHVQWFAVAHAGFFQVDADDVVVGRCLVVSKV